MPAIHLLGGDILLQDLAHGELTEIIFLLEAYLWGIDVDWHVIFEGICDSKSWIGVILLKNLEWLSVIEIAIVVFQI